MIEVPAPYWRLPEAVARRVDLTAEAKIVFAALAYLQPPDEAPFSLGSGRKRGLPVLREMVGIPPRSLQRAVVLLESRCLLAVTRRRGAHNTYLVTCASLAQDKPRGGAATSAKVAHDKRQVGATKQHTRTVRHRGQAPAPSGALGEGNGDGRLVALMERVRGKALGRQRENFLTAVREAREAGATDPMIAAAVLADGRGQVWAGPNAARAQARRLLGDFEPYFCPRNARTIKGLLDRVGTCRRLQERGDLEAGPAADVSATLRWALAHKAVLEAAVAWPEGASP